MPETKPNSRVQDTIQGSPFTRRWYLLKIFCKNISVLKIWAEPPVFYYSFIRFITRSHFPETVQKEPDRPPCKFLTSDHWQVYKSNTVHCKWLLLLNYLCSPHFLPFTPSAILCKDSETSPPLELSSGSGSEPTAHMPQRDVSLEALKGLLSLA